MCLGVRGLSDCVAEKTEARDKCRAPVAVSWNDRSARADPHRVGSIAWLIEADDGRGKILSEILQTAPILCRA